MPWIEKEGRSVDEARAAALAALGVPEDEAEIEVLREGARGLFGLGGESALVRVRPRSEAVDVRAAFHDRPPGNPVSAPPGSPVSAPPPASLSQAPAAPAVSAREPDVDLVATAPASPEPGEPHEDEPVHADAGTSPSTERQRMARDVAVAMVTGILERMSLEGEVTSRIAGGTVYVEVFGDEMGILIGRGGKTLEALQELVRAGVQRKVRARAAVVVDVESYWERRRETRPAGRRGQAQRTANR